MLSSRVLGPSSLRTSLRMAPRSTTTAPTSPARRVGMISQHFSASAASNASNEGSEPLVQFDAMHSLRKVTLNRPKAFNALNLEMIDLLQPQLEKWEASDLAGVVLFKGVGKHFCAGGDVKTLAKQLTDEQTWADSAAFFAKEYVTDHFIANMQTPVVSFMTGNTLGGGCGLSMHAPFRIATETTTLGMPETNIGLFPDVGANFFLPRLDGQLGVFLGLTGHNLKGKDALFSGFASHYVPGERLEALEARLSELAPTATHEDINAAIEEFVADAEELKTGAAYPLVGPKRRAIDAIFGRKSVEDIIAGLGELESGALAMDKIIFESEEADVSELQQWAKATRETLEHRSPTSLKLTLKAIREGAKLDIDEVFAMDLRIATACCNPEIHPDFKVGVTHLLIEKKKGRAPWSPAQLLDVQDATIQRNFFANPAPFSNPSVQPLQTRARGGARPYRNYPHTKFSLPSERDIKDIVTGEAKGSGKFALTADEVLKRVVQQSERLSGASEKVGLREKVQEVLQRKCKVGDQGTLKWVN